jgi:hypothetical protein
LTFSKQKAPATRGKKPILHAIILGLFTFALTPLVSLVITLPLLFLGKISEAYNPLIIIARIFDLHDLGGFFAAQFIFIGALAISGDFAASVISWRTSRSKKMASITFLSALTFQFIAIGIIIPLTIRQSQKTMEASIARERSYAQYATIGDVSYTLREQYSDQEITNLHPEFGPIFRKLEIVVPLSVSQAGEYQVTVEYLFEKDKVSGGTRMKSTTRAFEAKDHTVRFEFLANESRGNYGYWEPAAVEGKVEVQLLYSASKSGVSNRGQTAMKLVEIQKVKL